MSEEVLIQLLQDINSENVRFGTVVVSFSFHDGRPTCYEITTHRRRNIDSHKSPNRYDKVKTNGVREQ